MVERWHEKFNPARFLYGLNLETLLVQNQAFNENLVDHLHSPCILCNATEGSGLILNDKSFVCQTCFSELKTIQYPEKYDRLYRAFVAESEARRLAFIEFVRKCPFRAIALVSGVVFWISLVVLLKVPSLFLIPLVAAVIWGTTKSAHTTRLTNLQSIYPEPIAPVLFHFHDPNAELTARDKAILKVFNNWPGYPPFWHYLRQVVLARDGNRCQVTGCPSRVELHVHHKDALAHGGEHIPQNLVSLCAFHHGLEPQAGHERIWDEIRTRYFTMVQSHYRRNRTGTGSHVVRAHVRRLELVGDSELRELIAFHKLLCPNCRSEEIESLTQESSQKTVATCVSCGASWWAPRRLAEETGPRLAEVLVPTLNIGTWQTRWAMLETRTASQFHSWGPEKMERKRIVGNAVGTKTPLCPRCTSPMIHKRPHHGESWKPFWGCSQYRVTGCKGSRPLDSE